MTGDPLLGRQLANFRIERLLGHGGMAQVYYGRDVKLERPVAIKVIDVRFRGHPAYAKRFVREAQAVATWRHENIAQVYYADEDGDLYYFVMEYIDGQDLDQTLAQAAAKGELLPHPEVVRIGWAIASALDYAHQKGVIHRDVKPGNVMVARDGRVVLSDFGLALDVQQGSLGEVFGSAHYIAPEQARHSSDAVPASDLYSLGIILYEMLTGVVPFDDPSPTAMALQHLTVAPPPLRELNPELSAEVEAVLLKALSKPPADRYPTGKALMDALEKALLASSPTPAKRPSLPLPPAGARLSAMRQLQAEAALPPAARPARPVSPPPGRSRQVRPASVSPPRSESPKRSPVLGFAFAGCALIVLTVLGVGGAMMLSQVNSFQPGVSTATATEPALAALTSATATELPEMTATTVVVEATAIPEATSTVVPTSLPTQLSATETPLIESPTVTPVPTVKYPSGKHFRLYYDENSLYLHNLSPEPVAISSVAFERLDPAGSSLNRFDGWRWAQFYPTHHPGACVTLEILESTPLRPAACNGLYNSSRTPARDEPVIFWTAQADSTQFRVLWRASGPEEEVARCEIAAGTCEVFFP